MQRSMCRNEHLIIRLWKGCVQHNVVLYHEINDSDEGVLRQVIIPSCFRNLILHAAHDHIWI